MKKEQKVEKRALLREAKFHQFEHRKVSKEQAEEAERLNRGFEMMEEVDSDGEVDDD